ncbi:hypothetical protein Tco_0026268 [Tanacetum coccineum]
MASLDHRLNPLYAIKECSSCGSLYTRECCSIGSLENKILVPEPDSSPCCAKCGTPVDGPYCSGCALLRKKFEEDLLTYCVENGIFQDSQDTFESSDDNTNVINALQEPIIVNQDPGVKSLQGPPLINQNLSVTSGVTTILVNKWRTLRRLFTGVLIDNDWLLKSINTLVLSFGYDSKYLESLGKFHFSNIM